MRLGHAQIGQQKRHRFARHRRAAICMPCELPRQNVLTFTGLSDQFVRQTRQLSMRDHPANHIATENVEDHVEVKVGSLRWTVQLGDIPAPQLIGCSREQLRFLMTRMAQLVTAFAHLGVFSQNAMHRAY